MDDRIAAMPLIFSNPPPGVQHVIFPNGQHGWVPASSQPLYIAPPSSTTMSSQQATPNSRTIQQYNNQQNQWRNDSNRTNPRSSNSSQYDNMSANVASDNISISTPYDNDNIDGNDYPILADLFFDLVSQDVINKVTAYYNFITTDLLSAYYDVADTYRAIELSKSSLDLYAVVPTIPCDIVCFMLTSTTTTPTTSLETAVNTVMSTTVLSTTVDSTVISLVSPSSTAVTTVTSSDASATTSTSSTISTSIDTISAVTPILGITSGNTGPTTSTTSVAPAANSSRVPVISVDDYRPVAAATTARQLRELPEADSSKITLQSEIFSQILNSNMTADGLKLLRDMMEEQYVAAEKKQQETKLKEKIRCRVEDTVGNLIDHAIYKVPYPYKLAEDEAEMDLAIKKLQDDIWGPSRTPSPIRDDSTSPVPGVDIPLDTSSSLTAKAKPVVVTNSSTAPTSSSASVTSVKAPKRPVNVTNNKSLDMTHYLNKPSLAVQSTDCIISNVSATPIVPLDSSHSCNVYTYCITGQQFDFSYYFFV